MILGEQVCPLDSSPLVYLSGSYGQEDIDLSVRYCPRCDVAVVFVSPTRVAKPVDVLQWHRASGQLELRQEDRKRWNELPRQFRECWESNVRYHIEIFLRSRLSEKGSISCPEDGGRTPVIHRWRDTDGTDRLLSWCKYCGMGFVFAADRDYGWECCADIIWHAARRSYESLGDKPTAAGHRANPQAIDALPPLPEFLAAINR